LYALPVMASMSFSALVSLRSDTMRPIAIR
jgi:hypothetical protein